VFWKKVVNSLVLPVNDEGQGGGEGAESKDLLLLYDDHDLPTKLFLLFLSKETKSRRHLQPKAIPLLIKYMYYYC
jgi:hypothetical protein